VKDKAEHPTKLQLLDAAEDLLERNGPLGFGIEDLQSATGISTGSIYHHFKDFREIVVTALARRSYRSAQRDVTALLEVILQSDDRASFLTALRSMLDDIYSKRRAIDRMERLELLAMTRTKPDFFRAIREEQRQGTESFAGLVRVAQDRAWISKELDPSAFAAFLQSCTFGTVLNDISADPVSPEKMIDLVMQLLEGLAPRPDDPVSRPASS
jgi:AcrR family transcriptional regulator